jgi:uncharacterized protein YoxC
MNALEKELDNLHITLQVLTQNLKVQAMNTKLWSRHRSIEKKINQKAIECDNLLSEVIKIEKTHAIRMSEPIGMSEP